MQSNKQRQGTIRLPFRLAFREWQRPQTREMRPTTKIWRLWFPPFKQKFPGLGAVSFTHGSWPENIYNVAILRVLHLANWHLKRPNTRKKRRTIVKSRELECHAINRFQKSESPSRRPWCRKSWRSFWLLRIRVSPRHFLNWTPQSALWKTPECTRVQPVGGKFGVGFWRISGPNVFHRYVN